MSGGLLTGDWSAGEHVAGARVGEEGGCRGGDKTGTGEYKGTHLVDALVLVSTFVLFLLAGSTCSLCDV